MIGIGLALSVTKRFSISQLQASDPGVLESEDGLDLVTEDGVGIVTENYDGGGPAPPAFPTIPSMIARYSASNPDQTTETVNQTFAPTDVDVANNLISLPDMKFPRSGGSPDLATPIRYSTTGTPIGGLQNNTWYYLADMGANKYRAWPIAGPNDWQTTPGMIPNDYLLPAQNYFQEVNAVVITSQGSGTHRFESNPLIYRIKNMVGNDARLDLVSNSGPDNRHGLVEIVTDANGKKAFKLQRSAQEIGNNNFNVGGLAKGKVISQGAGGSDRTYARSLIGGRRVIWMTFKLEPDPFPPLTTSPKKWVQPVNVSGTLITFPHAHNFGTGDRILTRGSGGALPSSLNQATTYFFRSASSLSGSLHPTALDATNNTNAITLAMGAGDAFVMWCPTAVIADRRGFLSGVYGPDSGQSFNALAPRVAHHGPIGLGILTMNGTNIAVTGGNNGVFFLAASSASRNFKDLDRIYYWYPEQAVPPVRLANSVPLGIGYYWVTRQPGSTPRIRLHDTLADAQGSVGVSNSAAASIKFNGAIPSGSCFMVLAPERKAMITNNRFNTQTYHFDTTFDTNAVDVWTILVDYNNPAETNIIYKIFVNGVMVEKVVDTGTKQNLPAADGSTGQAWTFGCDLDSHAGYDGLIYDYILGASVNEVPDSDIIALHQYLMAT